MLATNERVDALETRMNSVEDAFGQKLAILERRLNASDVQWRATSSSIGHLTNSLREQRDDPVARNSRQSHPAYAPPQHADIQLPSWLDATGNDEDGIVSIGREWTHACDQSMTIGPQEDGISYAATTDAPETLCQRDSIASSRLSSAPSALSNLHIRLNNL
jgi:hypothetical protein